MLHTVFVCLGHPINAYMLQFALGIVLVGSPKAQIAAQIRCDFLIAVDSLIKENIDPWLMILKR